MNIETSYQGLVLHKFQCKNESEYAYWRFLLS